ncbi:hypothetical protein V5O48_018198, partial [Marasmius crinis-equi]
MSLCRRLELQSFLSGIRNTRRSPHGQDTPTRSVTISPKYFSAPQDPAGLLDYVNKNGLVQNISQSDANGSLQVDFFELEAAKQFTEQCNSETSLNLQTQFNPISPKPNAPTICDVWQGHSRKVRFVPSTSANWTTEEVLREFTAFGPITKVTSGNSRDAWFNISFYKFQDAVKVTRKFDPSWGTLQKVPARDAFTPNNYSQQMLVVPDFPMQPPSLLKLHAATRQYQVVHYHSDASNGILLNAIPVLMMSTFTPSPAVIPFGWTAEEVRSSIQDIHGGRLEQMNAHGIDYMVLSYQSPGIQGISDPQQALSAATNINNQLAAAIKNNTERFGAFASLPMHNASIAEAELRRTVTELGYVGAMLHDY